MANKVLSLADACSASLTWIKLAVLNPNNCNSHCDLRFTSHNMRGLWHTEAEIPQMPPMGHFHTKKVRGGKRSAAATCWWCSSSSCWLGANTHPIQFSITHAHALKLGQGLCRAGLSSLRMPESLCWPSRRKAVAALSPEKGSTVSY